MEELFERVLRGEHGEDLTPEQAEAFEVWLESDRARDLLAEAEAELDPLAEAYAPADPSPEAWAKIGDALREQAAGRVVVRPPELRAERNWGLTGLLAAGLLFAAAVGLLALGPRQGGGTDSLGTITTDVVAPRGPEALSANPSSPLEAPSGAPAQVTALEAGPGYRAAEALIDDALLVITVAATTSDDPQGH